MYLYLTLKPIKEGFDVKYQLFGQKRGNPNILKMTFAYLID